MQITAIEEKRKGLSAVYIDGEYAMKLDTFALAKSGVKVGSEIDDDRLHEIVIESNLSRAKEKAQDGLSLVRHVFVYVGALCLLCGNDRFDR